MQIKNFLFKPTKIILCGLNYRDHAKELKMKIPKEPVIFLKPLTTLIGPGDKIIYPKGVKRLDYEAELALVIKKKAKGIPFKEARKYILGFTCLNDVTARDLQNKDGQWTRAKSFDTFCPLGPHVETDLDVSNLRIQTYLNRKLKQDSTTSQLIFSVGYLVTFISKVMTLFPGDIISTGTPPGVGPMKPGDIVEVKIEGIGTLRNEVTNK
ncbi:MAG: fumarylacetoacetate hydrolase family protein [Candidatus Omnitrophica bacterium]|nr:fumarylacetoacetate hydrolase family protein [Candidatus Omnitrophota bacterium]MBU2251710.1 fumarylacetoacetate hydrolase family protein [Candidatus Omnitrophota bacterium]MBU2265733.1 fumarylacetoacetate hydrolase family protein [Candidatus Omnitrophota bacterium]